MRKRHFFQAIFFVAVIFFWFHPCFSQVKEETQEKPLEEQKVKLTVPSYKLSVIAAESFGYDSNPLLERESKGDLFEEFKYSLKFSKFWVHETTFNFNYNLNALNYNKFTEVSNLMNYINFGLDKRIWRFNLGTGYNTAYFYYPSSQDSDSFFHTFFFYAQDNTGRKLTNKLTLELGIKDYLHKKAIADTISTEQDKERVDKRLSLRYTISWSLKPGLLLNFNAKYSRNDSNARYLDYYDYDSYSVSPDFIWRITAKANLILGTSFLKKDYKSRQVTGSTYMQDDKSASAKCGLSYRLDKHNVLSLNYLYRNNSSSEKLEQYNENVFTCGWQYTF